MKLERKGSKNIFNGFLDFESYCFKFFLKPIALWVQFFYWRELYNAVKRGKNLKSLNQWFSTCFASRDLKHFEKHWIKAISSKIYKRPHHSIKSQTESHLTPADNKSIENKVIERGKSSQTLTDIVCYKTSLFPFSTWSQEINNLWDNEHWFSLDNGTNMYFSYSLFMYVHITRFYLHTKSPCMSWIASVEDALFFSKKKLLCRLNKRPKEMWGRKEMRLTKSWNLLNLHIKYQSFYVHCSASFMFAFLSLTSWNLNTNDQNSGFVCLLHLLTSQELWLMSD
jgi:hypothetical protein